MVAAAAISGHMTGRNGQTTKSLVGVLRNVLVSRMLTETQLMTHAGQRVKVVLLAASRPPNSARHWLYSDLKCINLCLITINSVSEIVGGVG